MSRSFIYMLTRSCKEENKKEYKTEIIFEELIAGSFSDEKT